MGEGETQVYGKIRKEKKRKENGRKRKKEGRKEMQRKERREGGGRPTVAWPVIAGGGRSWPELGGQSPKKENS